ncbi:hypothetical protein FPQ18DRAFT_422126 [Pyronema domesticum]|uniref:Similar to Galectin-3 acc. no. P38486 n=1 Tax=Pyronema omphalodes (strain CBS 100304) TaxID=1076935 RepID=U4L8M5_PYROM|nr:hypothetical protein FPQ18DRAFT_422126 [Pyronema domesticum]CCX06494.1 Similar to Galectin-3; acc. no. P38486 [Pyronema omphalodes CBS 100304]
MPVFPEIAAPGATPGLKNNATSSSMENDNMVATDINPETAAAAFIPAVSTAPSNTEKEKSAIYPALLPPARYPALEDPGRYPALEAPGRYPALEDPGRYPALEAPGRYPALKAPGRYPALEDPGRYPTLEAPGRYPSLEDSGRYPDLELPGTLHRRSWDSWKDSASRFWNDVTSYNVFGTESTPDPIPASVYDTTLIPLSSPPKELYTPASAEDYSFPATINVNQRNDDLGLTANLWNDHLSRPLPAVDASISSMPDADSPWSVRQSITPGNLVIHDLPIEDRYFVEENAWVNTKSHGWEQKPKVVAPFAPSYAPTPEMVDLHSFDLPGLSSGSSASSSGSFSPWSIDSTASSSTDSINALGRDIVAAEGTGRNAAQQQSFQDRLDKLMTTPPGVGIGGLDRAGHRGYPVVAQRDVALGMPPVRSLDWAAPSAAPSAAPNFAPAIMSSGAMVQEPEKTIMFLMVLFCLLFGKFFARR